MEKVVHAPVRGVLAAAIARLEQLEKAARPSVLGTIRDSRQQTAAQPTGMALDSPKAVSKPVGA